MVLFPGYTFHDYENLHRQKPLQSQLLLKHQVCQHPVQPSFYSSHRCWHSSTFEWNGFDNFTNYLSHYSQLAAISANHEQLQFQILDYPDLISSQPNREQVLAGLKLHCMFFFSKLNSHFPNPVNMPPIMTDYLLVISFNKNNCVINDFSFSFFKIFHKFLILLIFKIISVQINLLSIFTS